MRGDRKVPYKEDSTRGGSIINPLNYKGDVLVQVWMDSRILATLCNWLDSHGTYTRHLSEVTRRPLEVLTNLLVENDEVELVDDTIEARNQLERHYGVNLNVGGRGTKNVMHNIQLSVRRDELATYLGRGKRSDDVSRPLKDTKRIFFTDEDLRPPPGYQEPNQPIITSIPQRTKHNPIQSAIQESKPIESISEAVLKEGENIEEKMRRIAEADKAQDNTFDEFLQQQKKASE